MIRVNLLDTERKSLKARIPFQLGQKLTVGCSLILILAGLLIGWRYWTVSEASTRLDADISSAQQETVRLHSIIAQVQQFEQRKAQLQQRVGLIEQLRRDQTGPVHMLDQISRALPPMLWLTEMKQLPTGNEVLIDGRCTNLTGLSDFVTNLEASGYFRRSIEIVSSATETTGTPPTELIRFQIKAVFQPPADAKAGTPSRGSASVNEDQTPRG